jgi:hypothetical protein
VSGTITIGLTLYCHLCVMKGVKLEDDYLSSVQDLLAKIDVGCRNSLLIS